MNAGTPDVTIVGAGMAGMAAALKLLEIGLSVRVIESSTGVGGKFGAVNAKRGWHDFAWHVFGDWYPNFWKIVDDIGLSRSRDFVQKPTMSLLRPWNSGSSSPRVSTISSVGSPESFWSNLTSGIAHWSDVVLYSHAQYTLLCDADIEREEFLNRVTVNGYMRSLPLMSDVAALLHNELLLRIWAIPSYLVSARSYQTHLKLMAPYMRSPSALSMLRTNFEDGFWRPFLQAMARFPGFSLERGTRLTGIRLEPGGDRVEEIMLRRSGESSSRPEKVRSLIVAIPPDRLLDVVSDPDSLSLRQVAPELLDVAKLTSQDTAALTLFFKRRVDIPGIGDEPVALVDEIASTYALNDLAPRNGLASQYGISFMDIAQLWKLDHPTVLTVLASDVDSLKHLGDDEACAQVMGELRNYIRFDNRDVDWNYSHYQAHPGEPLFVNAVGTWEYRPEVRLTDSHGNTLDGQIWRKVRNLYLAGDYCRSQVDIVSLEGAVHGGMWAAHALSRAERALGRAVAEAAAPTRPHRVDFDEAKRTKAQLARWAEIAFKRSRVVRQQLVRAAQRRRVSSSVASLRSATGSVAEPNAAPNRATHYTDTVVAAKRQWEPSHDHNGATMRKLSTYPAFASPTSERAHVWAQRYRSDTRPITLKSGAVVPIPLLFWDCQALCVQAHVELDAADAILSEAGLRARASKSGKATVQIWAPDYVGTGVGPNEAVFAWIHVEPRRECRQEEKWTDVEKAPDHWWWWWYYGGSVLNQEYKQDVWGIPNSLAIVETSYTTDSKVARLLEDGQVAFRMRANVDGTSKRGEKMAPGAPPIRVRSVARRAHDDGENWLEFWMAGGLTYGNLADGAARAAARAAELKQMRNAAIPEEADEFYVRKGSAVEKLLTSIGITSETDKTWVFFPGNNGAIRIYDEKGTGRDPVQDTEDRYEVVRKGEAWVIREFDRPRR